MKIEFGVQEYFNELKLMDAQQYGQEEELYPWVYMLLQMAESRKKEILKECYQGVSIRDVHNGVKKKDNELIKLLHQKNENMENIRFWDVRKSKKMKKKIKNLI